MTVYTNPVSEKMNQIRDLNWKWYEQRNKLDALPQTEENLAKQAIVQSHIVRLRRMAQAIR